MKCLLPPSPRAVLIAALIALPVTTVAIAQTAAAPVQPQLVEAAPARPARPDQTIQRIRTEDAGTRIDEVRVGGETQSITVQPKTGNSTPAYEVKPPDSAKGNAPSQSNGDTNGSRVWNVLKF
jgi:hypothetical protein